MAIFNPNRKQGGTIELVRDAQGNYTTKEVGFNTLNSLSIPDFKTTATTTTTTDTKTATDNTGDTITSQTQMAFQMPDRDNNQIDTTGDMLQKSAEETSEALRDTFSTTRALMTSDDAYRGVTSPLEIKDPTEKFSTARKEMTQDEAYRQGIEDFKNYQDSILRGQAGTKAANRSSKGSAAVQRGEADPPGINFDFLKGDRFKQGTTVNRPNVDRMAADAMTRQEMVSGATPDDPTANTLGITADPVIGVKGPPSQISRPQVVGGTDLEADEGTKARADIKPKESALKTLSTSLNTAFKNIKTPMMMVVDAIGRSRGESAGAVAHNKQYFTDRGDGRIGGNPATDLYAGMNRTSMFGNLAKAGDKRIERREKTIKKRAESGNPVSQKFIDDTNNMKQQSKDYKQSLKEAPVTGTTKPGESGGSQATGGKIVCTMMNESYGFGSFRNKIWMKFHGNIAPEYQKGYHKLFLPLVNYAKQKGIANKIIKNILEHIAVHSTIDMRQTLRGKRHTLGRLYRKVILPLCYWAGKK